MASTAEESEVMERFAQSVIHDEALKNAVVNYAVARKYGMVPERQPEDDIAGVQASNEETPANGQKNSARTPETDEHTPTKKKGKQQCVRRLTATNHLCASSFAGKLVNKRRLGKPLVPMVFEEIINELDSETRFDFSNMAYKVRPSPMGVCKRTPMAA